jgi:hypothetical protein
MSTGVALKLLAPTLTVSAPTHNTPILPLAWCPETPPNAQTHVAIRPDDDIRDTLPPRVRRSGGGTGRPVHSSGSG